MHHIFAAVGLAALAACGGRATAPEQEPQPAPQISPEETTEAAPTTPATPEQTPSPTVTPTCGNGHQPAHDAACVGNSGCNAIATSWVGCECSRCDDERCVQVICTEPHPTPACPAERPRQGTSCDDDVNRNTCSYPIEEPCGCQLFDHCACDHGTWSCSHYVCECEG